LGTLLNLAGSDAGAGSCVHQVRRDSRGVEIEMIYLDHSHTDTPYAFYLPKEKVLHTADVGLIRTLYPIGGPDIYMPASEHDGFEPMPIRSRTNAAS